MKRFFLWFSCLLISSCKSMELDFSSPKNFPGDVIMSVADQKMSHDLELLLDKTKKSFYEQASTHIQENKEKEVLDTLYKRTITIVKQKFPYFKNEKLVERALVYESSLDLLKKKFDEGYYLYFINSLYKEGLKKIQDDQFLCGFDLLAVAARHGHENAALDLLKIQVDHYRKPTFYKELLKKEINRLDGKENKSSVEELLMNTAKKLNFDNSLTSQSNDYFSYCLWKDYLEDAQEYFKKLDDNTRLYKLDAIFDYCSLKKYDEISTEKLDFLSNLAQIEINTALLLADVYSDLSKKPLIVQTTKFFKNNNNENILRILKNFDVKKLETVERIYLNHYINKLQGTDYINRIISKKDCKSPYEKGLYQYFFSNEDDAKKNFTQGVNNNCWRSAGMLCWILKDKVLNGEVKTKFLEYYIDFIENFYKQEYVTFADRKIFAKVKSDLIDIFNKIIKKNLMGKVNRDIARIFLSAFERYNKENYLVLFAGVFLQNFHNEFSLSLKNKKNLNKELLELKKNLEKYINDDFLNKYEGIRFMYARIYYYAITNSSNVLLDEEYNIEKFINKIEKHFLPFFESQSEVQSEIYYNIAAAFFNKGNYSKAEFYIRKACQIENCLPSPTRISDRLRDLYNLSEVKSNFKEGSLLQTKSFNQLLLEHKGELIALHKNGLKNNPEPLKDSFSNQKTIMGEKKDLINLSLIGAYKGLLNMLYNKSFKIKNPLTKKFLEATKNIPIVNLEAVAIYCTYELVSIQRDLNNNSKNSFDFSKLQDLSTYLINAIKDEKSENIENNDLVYLCLNEAKNSFKGIVDLVPQDKRLLIKLLYDTLCNTLDLKKRATNQVTDSSNTQPSDENKETKQPFIQLKDSLLNIQSGKIDNIFSDD